ncbi:hypothetical protein Hypma_002084 [Hypsizygus marmoreus]|uniref:Uncharacterized protein n=1 Tax=Hypsizygus marmoreus TaxID=39966 RepID=A0A369K5C7_HYPMA|nr:hypothetical protein Hypma_002084 [Hypsizygus marmoreus]
MNTAFIQRYLRGMGTCYRYPRGAGPAIFNEGRKGPDSYDRGATHRSATPTNTTPEQRKLHAGLRGQNERSRPRQCERTPPLDDDERFMGLGEVMPGQDLWMFTREKQYLEMRWNENERTRRYSPKPTIGPGTEEQNPGNHIERFQRSERGSDSPDAGVRAIRRAYDNVREHTRTVKNALFVVSGGGRELGRRGDEKKKGNGRRKGNGKEKISKPRHIIIQHPLHSESRIRELGKAHRQLRALDQMHGPNINCVQHPYDVLTAYAIHPKYKIEHTAPVAISVPCIHPKLRVLSCSAFELLHVQHSLSSSVVVSHVAHSRRTTTFPPQRPTHSSHLDNDKSHIRRYCKRHSPRMIHHHSTTRTIFANVPILASFASQLQKGHSSYSFATSKAGSSPRNSTDSSPCAYRAHATRLTQLQPKARQSRYRSTLRPPTTYSNAALLLSIPVTATSSSRRDTYTYTHHLPLALDLTPVFGVRHSQNGFLVSVYPIPLCFWQSFTGYVSLWLLRLPDGLWEGTGLPSRTWRTWRTRTSRMSDEDGARIESPGFWRGRVADEIAGALDSEPAPTEKGLTTPFHATVLWRTGRRDALRLFDCLPYTVVTAYLWCGASCT